MFAGHVLQSVLWRCYESPTLSTIPRMIDYSLIYSQVVIVLCPCVMNPAVYPFTIKQ